MIYEIWAAAWIFVNCVFYGLMASSTFALVVAAVAALVLLGIAIYNGEGAL